MKIVELLSKINVPINNEQADFLARFEIEPKIPRSKLSEREVLLANHLTQQDIVLRKFNEETNEITYTKKIK